MSAHHTKTSLVNFPFSSLKRLSNAFLVSVLFFTTNAFAYNCANATGGNAFETTGQTVVGSGQWEQTCPDSASFLVMDIGLYSALFYPLLGPLTSHQDTYFDSGGNLLPAEYAAALTQYAGGGGSAEAAGMPEPEQIATSFGAGFIIGLPLFAVVFGARQIMRMMR